MKLRLSSLSLNSLFAPRGRGKVGAEFPCQRSVAVVEALEGRIAPAAILFIDYGDLFPGGTLATTQGGFRDVADSAVPGDKILGTTLDSAVAFNAATPLNIVAQSFTADERAQMLDIVTRAYLPLDVEIVELTANAKTTSDGRTVRAASSMADVVTTLRAGDAASKDAYIFVGTFIVAPGTANQVIYGPGGGGNSPSSPTLGVSSDLVAATNAHDDVAVVFSGGGFSNNTVNNISHEAGHNFGLRHSITNPAATASINLFHEAEIMSYRNTNATTSSIAFTRFPMIRGDGNTPTAGVDPVNYNDLAARNGQVTLYDQMRLDANIGANPDFSFVSGTGAHDIITISKSAGFANVSIQAFADAAYTTPITVPGLGGTTYSYSFPLTNSILLYAGGSNDRIVLDGDLGVNIQIDGMLGNDSIILNGNGAANAIYTPNPNSPDGVDRVTGNLVDTFGGTLSLGSTTISFENFETAGAITLQTIDTVSYVTPLAGADNLVLSLNGVNPQVAGTVNDGTGVIPLILQGVGRLAINTGSANDTLTVDSTSGLVAFANGIDYDGGAGFNGLTLTQTGGMAQISDTFSVGPNVGDVRSVIIGLSGTQRVFAQNLAPVVDTVPAATLTVNATNAANQISYQRGLGPTNGLVAVDEFETIEFSNKTDLVINALGGSDTVSLSSSTTPTGLARITVNAGSGDDIITTGPGLAVAVTFSGGLDNDLLDASGTTTSATLNGNEGADTLLGGSGNDVMDGGSGDDVFVGNGGTDDVGGGAGSSVGDTILLPGTMGADTFALALNATGHLVATVNGVTTTYRNFIGGPIVTSGIEQIATRGLAGVDGLTVDDTNGAISLPINFDGGDNADLLILTGGTAESDTYQPGPNPGQGTSTIVIGGVSQVVTFSNLEPVIDLVAGPLVVNANDAANAISYGVGRNDANTADDITRGRVSIDEQEFINFSNKTTLTINALGGSDTISLNNPNTPTGLTGITVNGGDPTGSDVVIVNGIAGTADRFVVQPTAAGAGSIENGSPSVAPAVNFSGFEGLSIVGQTADADGLAVTGTLGNDTFNLSPGADAAAGLLTGFAPGFAFVPVTYAGISEYVAPSTALLDKNTFVSLITGTVGGSDTVILDGSTADDVFNWDATLTFAAQVRVNTGSNIHTPVILSGNGGLFGATAQVTLRGLAGNDTFNVAPPPASGFNAYGLRVEGSDSDASSDTLNHTAAADAATTIDLGAATITSTGANTLSYSGVERINSTSSGAASTLAVTGTSGDDTINVTTAGAVGGSFVRLGVGGSPQFTYTGVGAASGLTVNGGAGGFDVLGILGSEGVDTVTSAGTTITSNGSAVTFGSDLDRVDVTTLGGNDSVNLATFAGAPAVIRGGDGNDTLTGTTLDDIIFGGAGNDVLVGGAGVDTQHGEDGNDIFGNPTLTSDGVADDAGNDFNFGGPGFDNFVWEPGDGADFNNGGEDGADIFRFFGSAAANVFTLRSGGTPTHFNALIGATNIDNHGIEDVIVDGQGGADTFLVEDLFATEVVSLNLILGAADAAVDSVTVNARAANDNLVVSTPAAGSVRVSGLRYNVNVTAAEAADSLTINGNDGDDAINVSIGVAAIMGVTLNGGVGNDVLSGDAANINGGDGNDTLIGSAINNTMDGGAGDDIFLGNGGTDAIGGGAGSSVGDTILLPGTAGDDTLALALNASGHLDATINGLLTTYTNFIGGPIATSGVERIKADGQDGKDALTLDSTNGALSIPVTFDGGLSSDSLTLTGGTATSNTYAPGPNPGAGTSTIVIGGVTQTVTFTGLEPVLDLVGGPLTVNGTNAANEINYGQGSVAANGLVSVDGFETIEFSNKTNLILNGLAGSDTINIGNPATPTGLTNISIEGGAGDDSVALFGTPGADDFTFTGIDATAGTLTLTGLAPVLYAGTEHALLVGFAGDDVFRVGSAAGRVQIIGGEGSDTVDFFDAPSGVVFNLDLLFVDQHVNGTGAVVSLGEVIENFVGSPFNDTIFARLVPFARSIDGQTPSMLPGVPGAPVPPGDRLTVDALNQFAQVMKLDSNTGSVSAPSYTVLTYDEIETLEVINSTGGGGFNDGSAYTASVSYKVRKTPTGIAVGDVNGDGFDDIVTVNSASRTVSVLLARGDGTFDAAVSYKTGGRAPRSVVLGNVDDNANIAGGDDDLDIIVTHGGSRNVGVLLNDGTGTFGLSTKFQTAAKSADLRVADFNEDGLLDIATLSAGASRLSILLNTGAGVAGTASFGAPTAFKTGGLLPSDFVVGNFDGDAAGHLDIAIAHFTGGFLNVHTGDGTGQFTKQPTKYKTGQGPTVLALADLNNDGVLDVAVNHETTQVLAILLGRGNAGGDLFEAKLPTRFSRAIQAPESMVTDDFDGDGNADLAFASEHGSAIRIALGTGDGFLKPFVRFALAPVPGGLIDPRLTSSIATGDFNGDGAPDFAVTNRVTNNVSVVLRNLTV